MFSDESWEFCAIILSIIEILLSIIQFSITIEFSILQFDMCELLPILTLEPTIEYLSITQSSPIITGPIILQ